MSSAWALSSVYVLFTFVFVASVALSSPDLIQVIYTFRCRFPQALQEAPEGLKALSLRSSQLSALSDFLPQWETNRRLVALDCEVAAARAASLASFRLRPVGIDNLRRKFAPYNLSKQADLVRRIFQPCPYLSWSLHS